jgi:dehydrogenase/reductase SDR family protein 1
MAEGSARVVFDSGLAGQVALVTGGTRSVGEGIATALARAGATVYITGTSTPEASARRIAEATDNEQVIGVKLDHLDDAATAQFFERLVSEQNGQLDILVNNAIGAAQFVLTDDYDPKARFFERPIGIWDSVHRIGLRSAWLMAWHAAPLMVARQSGLIVNIGSFGGVEHYLDTSHNIGKTGLDRFSFDAGQELKPDQVAVVSLYPGLVLTERVLRLYGERVRHSKAKETPEFVGRAVVALRQDPQLMAKTGKVVMACELAEEYGYVDIDGNLPADPVMKKLRETMSRPPERWVKDW